MVRSAHMATQTAGDVRTLVTRRVGLKHRVAVLGSDPALIDALRTNGCEVLVDPVSLDELAAFAPETVVAFDGFASDDGAGAFEMLASVAPNAQVVFSYAHAGSATAALTALTGATPPKALAERDVQRWLSAAGYAVSSRDIVVVPHVSTALSADTEAAFRALFEQLNPGAAADRLLIVAKRGAVATTPVERIAGLLSVVVSSDSLDVPALEGTLASLLGQQQRPLELILSSPLLLEATDKVLGKARVRGGITVAAVTLAPAASNWAARTNAGIAVSSGQYLATVEAGDSFSPFYFGSLIKCLASGTSAWALAVNDSSVPARFSPRTWLTRGAVDRQSYVIDRERTATFPLMFAEGVEGAEMMRFARLAALFEPVCTATGGKPTMNRAAPSENQLEAVMTVLRSRPLRMLRSLRLETEPEPHLLDVLRERVQKFF